MHTVHNELLQERLKFKPISNVNNGRYGLSKRLAAECFAFELHILLANLILQRKNTSVVSTQFRLLISFRGNAIELNKSQGKVFVADKNLVYLT